MLEASQPNKRVSRAGIAILALVATIAVGVVVSWGSFDESSHRCYNNPYENPYSPYYVPPNPYSPYSICCNPYAPVGSPYACAPGTPYVPPAKATPVSPPSDKTPPALLRGVQSVSGKGKKLKFVVKFQCPTEGCSVVGNLKLSIKKPKKSFTSSAVGSAPAGGNGALVFPLPKAAYKKLHKLKVKKVKIGLAFTATAVDAAGNPTSVGWSSSASVKRP